MPKFGDLGLKFEKQKLVERSRFIQFWNFGLFRVVLHFIWVFSSRSGSFWPVSGCFGSFVVLVSSCVCVCMCVCVCACVCVCVCVCVCTHVCLYIHSPWRLHMSGSVGMPGSRSTMLCWRRFFPLPSPFVATLEWSTKPF